MTQEEIAAAFTRIFGGLHPTPQDAFRAGVVVGESGEVVPPLRVHAVLWDDAPTTYEVRKPGRGTADDWEPGECLGVFDTRAEAEAFAAGVSSVDGRKRG
jgi:hypothetical protein